MDSPEKTIDLIRKRLAGVRGDEDPDDGRHPTAVALLLSYEDDGLSVFFIERAFDDKDPWSGNIGFPGGRMAGSDPDLQATAERETLEEVGIALGNAEFLGRLPDIVGAHLPVRVACFVYYLERFGQPVLNLEVNDAFLVPLSLLTDSDRHLTARVSFGDELLDVPAIKLPLTGKAVLWGITYRLIKGFMDIISTDKKGSQK